MTKDFKSILVGETTQTNVSTTADGYEPHISVNPYCMNYEIGKKTKAKKGTVGLFCFEDLDSALKYKYSHDSVRPDSILIKCKGYSKQDLPPLIPYFIDEGNLNQFYNKKIPPNKLRTYAIGLNPPITGTVLYDTVKLLEVL
jgi:hypothetical protein